MQKAQTNDDKKQSKTRRINITLSLFYKTLRSKRKIKNRREKGMEETKIKLMELPNIYD